MKHTQAYKGYTIYYIFQSGMYTAYIGGLFNSADTLKGIKHLINAYINKG